MKVDLPFCADGGVTEYLERLREFPSLDREQTKVLAMRFREGDEDAHRRLVHHNLLLVVGVARRFPGHENRLPVMINAGNQGLIKALEYFDPARGYLFSTYAVHWIRRAIEIATGEEYPDAEEG